MATLRDALRGGKPLIGTLLTVDSTEVAEALALSGFDWIFIDLEHGSLSIQDAQRALQAIANRCHTLVRVPDGTTENIKRVLDMGCSGIIVPMVNTVAYAQRIAALSKYPPVGERSVGIGRAQGYGLRFTEYLEVANEQTTVVVQIEHRDAIANVDQIVAVPGIDAVFVGPYDLSNSMGLVGQVNHPDVRAAIDKVRATCARTNSPMGIFCSTTEQAQREIKSGFGLVAVGADLSLMTNSAKSLLDDLRAT
jgi:2-keto-3-deoxy-L-rhamnonate aldolase RhmA